MKHAAPPGQESLFDRYELKPVAPAPHAAGSRTSYDAARSVDDELPRLEWIVFQTICAAGAEGMTDDEIEQATGLSHQTASARRRGLVLKQRVVPDGERSRPTRSGRRAQVWLATKPKV
jgi:hypothetical protein